MITRALLDESTAAAVTAWPQRLVARVPMRCVLRCPPFWLPVGGIGVLAALRAGRRR